MNHLKRLLILILVPLSLTIIPSNILASTNQQSYAFKSKSCIHGNTFGINNRLTFNITHGETLKVQSGKNKTESFTKVFTTKETGKAFQFTDRSNNSFLYVTEATNNSLHALQLNTENGTIHTNVDSGRSGLGSKIVSYQNYLYVITHINGYQDSISIYNNNNPAEPIYEKEIYVDQLITDLQVNNTELFVLTNSEDESTRQMIYSFDLSESPQAPKLIASNMFASQAQASELVISDDIIYVLASNKTITFYDRYSLSLINSYATDQQLSDISIEPGSSFLWGISKADRTVQLFDVSDFADIHAVNPTSTFYEPVSIISTNNAAYVGLANGNLAIYSTDGISVIETHQMVVDAEIVPNILELDSQLLLVSSKSSNLLYVYTFTNETLPVLKTSYAIAGRIGGIEVISTFQQSLFVGSTFILTSTSGKELLSKCDSALGSNTITNSLDFSINKNITKVTIQYPIELGGGVKFSVKRLIGNKFIYKYYNQAGELIQSKKI